MYRENIKYLCFYNDKLCYILYIYSTKSVCLNNEFTNDLGVF